MTPRDYQRLKRKDPEYRKHQARLTKESRERNRTKPSYVIRTLLSQAKQRAKVLGIEFNLTKQDLSLPEKCPVFGVPFNLKATRVPSPDSPTLDRADPSKGYTKENVTVICFKANSLKNNLMLHEIEKLIVYFDKTPNPLSTEPVYSKTKRDMVYQAMLRALRNDIPFNLFSTDFEIPEICPVFQIPLKLHKGPLSDNSPTLDRVDVTKGYVFDNICVISFKANRAKRNGTKEDFVKIKKYMERVLNA